MGNDQSDNDKRVDNVLQVSAVVTSAIPYLGGPISNIISGKLAARQQRRVNEMLLGLADELRDFKSEASAKYCATDDFEELFEKVAMKVAEERNEEKRRLLRTFIVDTIRNPARPYDEMVRILDSLSWMQGGHMKLIAAILVEPDPNPPGWSGSVLGTLKRRLPNIGEVQILELLQQLQDARITTLADPNVMMTASGAEDLQRGLSRFGLDLAKYIMQ